MRLRFIILVEFCVSKQDTQSKAPSAFQGFVWTKVLILGFDLWNARLILSFISIKCPNSIWVHNINSTQKEQYCVPKAWLGRLLKARIEFLRLTFQKWDVYAQLNALEKFFKICHIHGIRKQCSFFSFFISY